MNSNIYGRPYNFQANPTNTQSSLHNFISNPTVQTAAYTTGAAAIGSLLGGPMGGAIGAGSVPIVQNIIGAQSGNAQPWGQILPEIAMSALGGGLGSSLAGPLGAGIGGAAVSYVDNMFDGQAGIGYQSGMHYYQPGQAVVTNNSYQPGQSMVTAYGPTQPGLGYQASYNGTAPTQKRSCGCGHSR